MSDTPVDSSKRTWLIASSCAGAVGGVATAVPFVSSFQPSERPRPPARRSKWISPPQAGRKADRRMARQAGLDHARTPEQLAALPKTDAQLADPKSERKPGPSSRRNTPQRGPLHQARSVGGGRHLHPPGLLALDKFQPGPQPSLPDDWQGGFLCPCHGSTFDMAGRVFKNKPAPDNLEVPPHMYLSDSKLLIGEDKKA
jgi:ubiquinol-cytochrome c reductase iron-sulfur subunit